MPPRRSLILVGLVVLLTAGAAFYFWQARLAAKQAGQAALQQEVLKRGTIAATVSATGFLAPDNQVNLYFSTASALPVEEVNVVLGQKVRRGDILARLNSQDLELSVTQAELALQAVRLALAQLQAPPRPEDVALAEANVRVARAQVYAASQGNSPQAVEIARLNLLVAQNTLDRTHKQMDILVEEGGDLGWLAKNALLQPRADQQVLAAKTADEQYHAAQAPPGFANAASALAAVEQAQVALDRLKSGPLPEDLKIAQLQVDQAQAALEVAQHNLAAAQILAPFDGVVTAVNIRPGELTASAVPAVVLADVNHFFLDVGVDEVDVARVAVGQAVTVTLDALPNALLTGKVEKIALLATNNANGVVSYSVRVSLDPTQAVVRGGMTATAEIVVAEARDVVLVPNWAIRRDRESGLTYVGILRNGVLGEVEVKLGLHNETYSEVTSGLAENDVVAVDTTREQIRLLGGGQ